MYQYNPPQKFLKGGGRPALDPPLPHPHFLSDLKPWKELAVLREKIGGGGVIVIVYFGDVNLRGSFYDLVLACIDKLVSLIIGLKKLQKVIPIYQIYSL